MRSVLRPLALLLVFATVAVCGGIFVVNVIRRPVDGAIDSYTATFTNVAGLRVGNDVRLLGVPVGKVSRIALQQRSDAVTAEVTFTLAHDQHLYADSIVGIRYLNLTGIRYLDVVQPTVSGSPRRAGDHLSVASTTPSFDITRVFRGLAPVFSAMNPDEINHLFEGVLALVEGDGSGLSTTVASLTKALRFVDDRKTVVDKLISDLTAVATSINGRSQFLEPVFEYLSDLVGSLVDNEQQLELLADSTGEVLTSADHLLASIGLRPNETPDLNSFVRQVVPAAKSVLGVLSLTPGILNAINGALPAAPGTGVDRRCSKGVARLPENMSVFIRGTGVTLCRR